MCSVEDNIKEWLYKMRTDNPHYMAPNQEVSFRCELAGKATIYDALRTRSL